MISDGEPPCMVTIGASYSGQAEEHPPSSSYIHLFFSVTELPQEISKTNFFVSPDSCSYTSRLHDLYTVHVCRAKVFLSCQGTQSRPDAEDLSATTALCQHGAESEIPVEVKGCWKLHSA